MEGNTYTGAMARLAAIFDRVLARSVKVECCERCGYQDCVCGDPEFEAFVSQELDAAEQVEQ
jgi:hypothetical protein